MFLGLRSRYFKILKKKLDFSPKRNYFINNVSKTGVLQREKEPKMYTKLEDERVRCGYGEGFVAQKLGLTERVYRLRVKSGAFRLSEARELSALYNQPVEYLFGNII